MNPKLCLSLALVLSGGWLGCTTARQRPPVGQAGTPLYVHFGFAASDSVGRYLSARIRFGEAIFVGGSDYWELKGRIDRPGTNLVADLVGNSGPEAQFYRGNIVLEQPFFGQGGAASGGVVPMWFAVSTNANSQAIVGQVNALSGLTNRPVHSANTAGQPAPVVANAPHPIDPVTGLPPGHRLIDPVTGLPLKTTNSQP